MDGPQVLLIAMGFGVGILAIVEDFVVGLILFHPTNHQTFPVVVLHVNFEELAIIAWYWQFIKKLEILDAV